MNLNGKQFDFYIFGVGGTGGHLCDLLTQFLHGVKNEQYSLTLIDGDTVEPKNLERQPFEVEDIGRNKAEALSEYLSCRHDENIRYYDGYITTALEIKALLESAEAMYKDRSNSLPVLIGCVDNDACRKVLHEVFYGTPWKNDPFPDMVYIDSGNEFSHGEVVFALKLGGRIVSPPKAYYYEDIMEGQHTPVTEMSCEELNSVAPQHIVTNVLAANVIMTGLAKLFKDGICETGIVHFNSFEFTMRQIPFMPPEEALKKIDLNKAGGALYDF